MKMSYESSRLISRTQSLIKERGNLCKVAAVRKEVSPDFWPVVDFQPLVNNEIPAELFSTGSISVMTAIELLAVLVEQDAVL